MTKRLFLMFFLLLGIVLMVAQVDFNRSSISSVESLWIRQGALQNIPQFPYPFFEKMISHYIEMPRFDFNVLPENLLTDFREQANALSNITPLALAEILNNTVGVQIREILEDPIIREARANDFRREGWEASFAATRGNSLGLTVEELESLMNSAFVYLPYINNFTIRRDGNDIVADIHGGIIWYQVLVAPNGDVDMELRVAQVAEGRGLSQITSSSADNTYNTFSFSGQTWFVTEEQYAIYDAIQAWARNLQVKTREIPEFNVSAQIVEIRPDRRYGARVGKREGLHLDDGFFILESFEGRDGVVRSRQIGFVRIERNADNRHNPNAVSIFRQYLGKDAAVGMTLQENPRLGVDLRAYTGYQTGMNIPAEYTKLFNDDNILAEDSKEQIFFAIEGAYNLAPITSISQFFAEVELTWGLPIAKYNMNANRAGEFVYTLGGYLGISKKLWGGRNALQVDGKFGYDRLAMTGTFWGRELTYSMDAIGVKGGLSYNFLATPNLEFNLGASAKHGFKPLSLNLKWGDREESYIGNDVRKRYPALQLGGLMFYAGFSYSLRQSKTNLFGSLDAERKH